MEFIKNKKALASSEARKQALDLLEAGLGAIDPFALMKKSLRYSAKFNCLTVQNTEYNLITGRIFVVGGGKAAGRMAEALEDVIGEKNITAGIVNGLKKNSRLKKIKVIKAGHPLPNGAGVKGVEKMLALKKAYGINAKDLVIILLSGGGSALLPAPAAGISLQDKQATTDILIKSGAGIREINAVRKHLSKIKGGRLAEFFAPAQVLSLIISDVADNDPQTIASGPGAIDKTVYRDAFEVLEKYSLLKKIPPAVEAYLNRSMQTNAPETPKKLARTANFIIGSNADILEAMALEAKRKNLKPLIAAMNMPREINIEVKEFIENIRAGKFKGYDILLFGSSVLINVLGKSGQGGRNQHFAALFASAFNLAENWALACISSDGRDYLSGIGGAVVDNDTLSQAAGKGLDLNAHIENFDTYNLFDKLKNSLIKMDGTGTNVGDIGVLVINS